jgi:hypothetical protein|tara:strand:+ start:70 stop:843 length:774 start_codon:yes stop_codon:yes gene_type:complete
MAVFRNAQGYMLSPAPVNVGIGATVTAASTTQVPVLLEDLIVASSAFDGTVSQIRVAGQSIFASSGTVPTNVFSAVAQTEGYRSISIPINQQQQLSVDFVGGAAAANYSFACGTTPIPQDAVVPTDMIGSALSYVAGFDGGFTNIAAGATATLTMTILRPVVLGRLVLCLDTDPDSINGLADVNINSILVNNIELKSGDAASSIPAQVAAVKSTLDQDLLLAYPAELNSTVSVQITNNTAGPINIGGAIFCMPDLRS